MTKWETASKKEKQTPKWLKAETMVMVDARVQPELTTVKGRWGDREVYIIETKEFGKVYVSKIQLMLIAEVLQKTFGDGAYNDFVSVQL